MPVDITNDRFVALTADLHKRLCKAAHAEPLYRHGYRHGDPWCSWRAENNAGRAGYFDPHDDSMPDNWDGATHIEWLDSARMLLQLIEGARGENPLTTAEQIAALFGALAS